MKRLVVGLVAICCSALVSIAQDNIKRPDSYFYQCGADAYSEGDYSKSLLYFEDELQQNPKNGYAILWKAYIYEINSMYGDAMTSVDKALKFIPKKDKTWRAMCYSLRASVQAELGDTAQALSDYETAFKTNADEEYIQNKCELLNEQGRYAEVDKDMQRAMALNPNNAVNWTYLGRNEDAKGNHDAAIEKYSYAIKLSPAYSSAYVFRAASYFILHKYKEACQDAIAALSIDNNDKAYVELYLLADSAMTTLESQLRSAQLKNPNDASWSYYLGLVQVHMDKYNDAEDSFRKAYDIANYEGETSSTLLIQQNLMETLQQLGKYAEALEVSDRCLAIDSTSARTWYDRAFSYYELGKPMVAIDNLNSALKFSPEDDDLYILRSRYYVTAKMYRNALDDINTAISLDDENSIYLNFRSVIYTLMDRKTEAEADVKSVIEREESKDSLNQSTYALAEAYARSGQNAKVKDLLFNNLYKDKKIDSGDEYILACFYSIMNEKDEALNHLETALKGSVHYFTLIENDPDLDNVRQTERYKQLIETYKNKMERENSSSAASVADDAEYVEEIVEVPFTKENGIYKVKCTINDLPLSFYFDTGASDVSISSVEAAFMLKNDYLKASDIKGSAAYGDAEGNLNEGTVIMLRKINFGGLELDNVKASVVHNQQAPLLLGQTVLSRLGKIEIDYSKSALKITTKKRK